MEGVMNRLVLSVVLALGLLAQATSAEAQWGAVPQRSRHSQGLEIFGGLGGNVCLESGDASCDNLDPSVAMMLGVGYRFSSFFGLYLDMNYGFLSPDYPDDYTGSKDASFYSMSLMPTARFFAELRDAEVYGGFGFGYSRMGIENDDADLYLNSWANVKFLVGGAIQIWPKLYVGAEVQLTYNIDGDWESCYESGGDTDCSSGDTDVVDLLQPMAFVKYRF